ncbi:MAG: hypothetical protein OXI96_06020 [Acidimicrobiaceae bacterium]|nr:hypothetical protein [Acidimicrobiaceae bacterium]
MAEFRFTLEVVRSSCSENDFAEWVAADSSAIGHMSRKGRDYIHFAAQADSLEAAVDDAVSVLNQWNGLELVSLQANGDNS